MRIDADASPDDAAEVLRGLREFNEVRLGPAGEQPVRIVVRDGHGNLLARARGCTPVSLDTFEYPARPFSEKRGYKLFWTLEGYPPGYRQFYLTKEL